jgi:hypothetical protein
MVVDRLAPSDRHHPGSRVTSVHLVVGSHRGDEGLLKAIFGVVVSDHRPQERQDRYAVFVEKPLKRRLGHRGSGVFGLTQWVERVTARRAYS